MNYFVHLTLYSFSVTNICTGLMSTLNYNDNHLTLMLNIAANTYYATQVTAHYCPKQHFYCNSLYDPYCQEIIYYT